MSILSFFIHERPICGAGEAGAVFRDTGTVMVIGCGVSCPHYFLPYTVKKKDRNVFSQVPFIAD